MGTQYDLSRVGVRATVPVDGEVYYAAIAKGLAVGFRRGKREGWHARKYDPVTKKLTYAKLSEDISTLKPGEQWEAACTAARKWANQTIVVAARDRITVGQAGERYRDAHLTQANVKPSVKRLILDDPIGRISLHLLTEADARAWRLRWAKLERRNGMPALATLNREITLLRSVLNEALRDKLVASSAAWEQELKPLAGTAGRREIYLDRPMRDKLIAAIPEDLRPLFIALSSLPLRVGALARATAGDYNPATRELIVRHDKVGGTRRIQVHPKTAPIFQAARAGKLPTAPLFAQRNGNAWTKEQWGDVIRDAAKEVGAPIGTCAYSFRHSNITDMILAGIDVLRVAKLSGTSIAMVESHYGHLIAGDEALAVLA